MIVAAFMLATDDTAYMVEVLGNSNDIGEIQTGVEAIIGMPVINENYITAPRIFARTHSE